MDAMTHFVDTPGGRVIFPEPEVPENCEICGKRAELRPYGRNQARVCFACGMKDETEAKRQFSKLLDGPNIHRISVEASEGTYIHDSQNGIIAL